MADPLIFVSIAAYRDAQTGPTISDLYSRAARPERVRVGLCWQRADDEDDRVLLPHLNGGVRVRSYRAEDSRGAGWARNVAHGLRTGDEEFVLQVDSHMRFHDGWDERLLRILGTCPSARPVLSTYPSPFEPPRRLDPCGVYELVPREFDAHGVLSFSGVPVTSPTPSPCAWLAGGFIFAPALFFDEVPYDPQVYFLGEEVTLAARGWTRGWDYFAPDECVLHHYYGRARDPKHWGDHSGWVDVNSVSVRRVRHILGVSRDPSPEVTDALDGPLGLGSARSLEAFQRFAGVDFARRAIYPR